MDPLAATDHCWSLAAIDCWMMVDMLVLTTWQKILFINTYWKWFRTSSMVLKGHLPFSTNKNLQHVVLWAAELPNRLPALPLWTHPYHHQLPTTVPLTSMNHQGPINHYISLYQYRLSSPSTLIEPVWISQQNILYHQLISNHLTIIKHHHHHLIQPSFNHRLTNA